MHGMSAGKREEATVLNHELDIVPRAMLYCHVSQACAYHATVL